MLRKIGNLPRYLLAILKRRCKEYFEAGTGIEMRIL